MTDNLTDALDVGVFYLIGNEEGKLFVLGAAEICAVARSYALR
jgi:hypothetical protein